MTSKRAMDAARKMFAEFGELPFEKHAIDCAARHFEAYALQELAQEREACADAIESDADICLDVECDHHRCDYAARFARVIRARGQGTGGDMSEREEALALASRVLDRPHSDPDDDLAVLARQLKRATERLEGEQALNAHKDVEIGMLEQRAEKAECERDFAAKTANHAMDVAGAAQRERDELRDSCLHHSLMLDHEHQAEKEREVLAEKLRVAETDFKHVEEDREFWLNRALAAEEKLRTLTETLESMATDGSGKGMGGGLRRDGNDLRDIAHEALAKIRGDNG